jgi:hypothetical protein
VRKIGDCFAANGLFKKAPHFNDAEITCRYLAITDLKIKFSGAFDFSNFIKR